MSSESLHVIELAVAWEHAEVRYCDRYAFERGVVEAASLPGDLSQLLRATPQATWVETACEPGTLTASFDTGHVRWIDRGDFSQRFGRARMSPAVGRFYPQGVIAAALDGSARERTPFRLLDEAADGFEVDLNHPLATYSLSLAARRETFRIPFASPPPTPSDPLTALLDTGPGMQVPLPGSTRHPGEPLSRPDSADDARFYAEPRLVQHIDAAAIAEVRAIHARLLQPGTRVLDLMSSWTTHLPAGFGPVELSGLGMNRVELDANPLLSERCVHDLNARPRLPYADNSFDAVICAMSVEYLVRPLAVFREVARVLRPGGLFINTFSERWFPPKVVEVWTELHPFERLGLVIEYYRDAGGFTDIEAETVRGYPRPADDSYADTMVVADPVYAVWGRAVC